MNEKAPDTPPRQHGGRHLWEINAVREGFILAAFILILWSLWYLRPIVLPILVSFGLAYIVDPIVTRIRQRLAIPRGVLAVAVLVILAVVCFGFGAWAWPHVVEQVSALVDRLPSYLGSVSDRFGIDVDKMRNQIASGLKLNPQDAIQGLANGSARVFGFVGSVVGTMTYFVMAVFLMVTMFVFLSSRFDRLWKVKKLLPESKRELFCKLVRGVDQACSGYVRGQLVVAIFTTTGFCIGFWLADVPYWFVVSIIGGVLSLIPYGQCSGWLLAIALKYLESTAAQGGPSGSILSVILLPSLVYAITQSTETWLITPLVQARATRLHPVTIILVLLTGGFVAGIVGLVLAIPVTASLKVVYRELDVSGLLEEGDSQS